MGGVRTLALLLALAAGCDEQRGASAEPDGQAGQGGAAARGVPSDAGDSGQLRCSEPTGSYEASYTAQSGTCGDFTAPARVAFDGSAGGPATRIETFAAFEVTTEIVVQGCSVRITQVVRDAQNEIVVRIASDDLSIGEDGRISGTATVTRFEGDETTCTGAYAMELRQLPGITAP